MTKRNRKYLLVISYRDSEVPKAALERLDGSDIHGVAIELDGDNFKLNTYANATKARDYFVGAYIAHGELTDPTTENVLELMDEDGIDKVCAYDIEDNDKFIEWLNSDADVLVFKREGPAAILVFSGIPGGLGKRVQLF